MIAVEKELTAKNQQPHPKRKAQLAARHTRADNSSNDSANHSTLDQMKQQVSARRMAEPMRPASDQRNNEAERNVGAHHLRRRKRGQTQQRGRAKSARSG